MKVTCPSADTSIVSAPVAATATTNAIIIAIIISITPPPEPYIIPLVHCHIQGNIFQ